ncbi:MAG: hypothetical protein ACLR23_26270 [Clostridia bacterium]
MIIDVRVAESLSDFDGGGEGLRREHRDLQEIRHATDPVPRRIASASEPMSSQDFSEEMTIPYAMAVCRLLKSHAGFRYRHRHILISPPPAEAVRSLARASFGRSGKSVSTVTDYDDLTDAHEQLKI